jgi:uncharacterized protein YecE (DUF72 family)
MTRSPTQHIRVGVGGWTYEPWRGAFYPDDLPQKRELEYASRKLTAIEINGTYYGSQKPESFAKWRDETPDDFVFAVKGPRFAVNRRVLAEAGPAIERFFATGVAELKQKLGPINWQFMPTKIFDPADFGAFLSMLPKSIGARRVRHAVEVRHPSFASADFVALAAQHGVAVVLAGDSKYPLIPDPTADFIYARIMGTTQAEPDGYSPTALDRWARRARIWAESGVPGDLPLLGKPPRKAARDVFIFVINGHKPRNPRAAMALQERLR